MYLVGYETLMMRAKEWVGGGGGYEQGPETSGSRQEGQAQQDADARNDHENTLPLGGRLEGHVRLYGERGGGGAERDGHHEKLDEGPRVSTKAIGLKYRGQEPRD